MVSTKLIASATAFVLAGNANAWFTKATWFYPGLGSCGWYHGDNDFIIALPIWEMNYFGYKYRCGHRVWLNRDGRRAEAIVADTCPGCQNYDIDLSPGLFNALGGGDGHFQVEWGYI